MFATKLKLTVAAAAFALAGIAGSAEAAPINGGFSIGAGVANTNLLTTNSIDFTTDAQVQATSGTYAGLLSVGQMGSIADILSLSSFSGITAFLDFGGGVTVDFNNITSITRSTTPTGNTIVITGSGTYNAPGSDSTGGTINITGQDAGGTGTSVSISGSFGASGTPVPEPATAALLGTALLGLGLARRRKSH